MRRGSPSFTRSFRTPPFHAQPFYRGALFHVGRTDMMHQYPFSTADHYRYSQAGDITAVGGKILLTVLVDPFYDIYVRRYRISAWHQAGGRAVAIVPGATDRDILLVDITRSGGDVHTQNPIDIFAFNEEPDDRNFPGWFLPGSSKLEFSVTHQITTGANWGLPIKVRLSLFGYRIRKGA